MEYAQCSASMHVATQVIFSINNTGIFSVKKKKKTKQATQRCMLHYVIMIILHLFPYSILIFILSVPPQGPHHSDDWILVQYYCVSIRWIAFLVASHSHHDWSRAGRKSDFF